MATVVVARQQRATGISVCGYVDTFTPARRPAGSVALSVVA
jgi:hypothetical protein